jgi:UDP-2,3-diacylglucosamine pyrophosphatase LpxH
MTKQITKYKTMCISDIHLGTKDCQADILNNFLKHHTCENLFLVGDIIDGWKINRTNGDGNRVTVMLFAVS